MTREELIDKLQSISFHVKITALTSEYCLEIAVMTGNGAYTSWVGYHEWNVYKLHGVDAKKWTKIKANLGNNSLKLEDIKETDFELLYKSQESAANINMPCTVFFNGLSEMPNICPEEVFCICERKPVFFAEERALLETLKERYAESIQPWSEMDTNELQYWLEKYENAESFPFCTFSDD